MRITSNAMMRNYGNHLNRQLTQANQARMRALTGRQFQYGSEDLSGAARTRQLYRDLQQNEVYLWNIGDAKKQFEQAEANLLGVSEQIRGAYANVLEAIDGTKGEDERAILAEQLRSLQQQIVMDMNGRFNDKYLFGGSSTGTAPFSMDDDGTVRYRGLDISDPANYDKLQEMAGENMYLDIGYGLKFLDVPGEVNVVDPNSAFDMALSGLNFLGFGQDGEGLENNIIVLLGQLADALESPNYTHEGTKPLVDKLGAQYKTMQVNITALDSKANFLDITQTRLESAQEKINERLAEVAYIDEALAYTLYDYEMYVYTAALKLGAGILSTSFLDFIT